MIEKTKWDAKRYEKSANFVSRYGVALIERLDPKHGEKILDLGCGDGSVAKEIEMFGAKVIGVDLSYSMVERTREKGIEAYVRSAKEIDFESEFDAVFSNAVLHWVKEPKIVARKIYEALKPNGRFVAEFGGEGNVSKLLEIITKTANDDSRFEKFVNEWYFPNCQEYGAILKSVGFDIKICQLVPREAEIGHIKEWMELFLNSYLDKLSTQDRELFKERVAQNAKNSLFSKEKGWRADYVRIIVEAYKS
jgi:2-isopropylmalate synthase